MTTQEKFLLAKKLLLDFKEYVLWIHKIAQGTDYDMTEGHADLCDTLQKYAEGRNEKRNLMINCPVGMGKSLMMQYFITWCFARNKNSMFCYVSFGEKLIKKLSRDSRNLMMMPEWEELFGKEMDPGDKSVLNYHLISGGIRSGLTAGTISSALLGVDCGVPGQPGFSGALILDDICSPEIVRSVHEQVETPDIYQRKLSTRRRTPTTPTICIMQRLDMNDFAGWVKKNEPDQWEFKVIKAIKDDGESFYPKRYPIDELRRLEKQNPFMFAAMYQQEPVENYGAYFHEDWIKTFRATPEKFQKVFITTDFGFTSTGDKSLFVCWGLASDNNLYQLGSRMGKWESPDAKKYCVEFFRRCRTLYKQLRRVYVENTLSGIGFIQEMKRECPDMAIVPLKRGAKKNKLNRAESAMTWMEAGRVYFREADPNFVAMRAELLAYNPADKNPKDEWCFVAGTKIMTIWGERPIEDIKVGDILWTPIGWTKVKETGHREAEVITRLGLTGTSDHKIWDPVHFRFDCLGDVCYFEPRLYLRSIKWRVMKSYLMANGISLTKRQDIISSMTRNMRTELARPFIGLFGNFIRERRYLRAMLFIILTATGVITTTLTLCALALLSTLGFIGGARARANGCKSILREPKTLSKKRVRGTRAKKAGKRLLRLLKQVWTRLGRQEPVCYAGDNLTTVSQKTPTTERSANGVKTAGNTKRCDVVYTIKTGNGVYVANSRLVSNCDNVGDATELAFNNKVGSIFL